MFSFCRKKTIVIDCFTNRADVYEYSKIDYANKFLPKWWKETPVKTQLSFFPEPTIRTCAGFTSLYKEGLIIPMWSDLAIHIAPIGQTSFKWQFSDKQSTASTHSEAQRGNYLPEKEYVHIKIDSPWMLKSNKMVKWIWMQPSWNFDNFSKIHIPPGIIEYKYQHGTNINMFIKREVEESVVNINFGQPMAHIIPEADVNIELKHHLVSNEEYDKLYQLHTNISFINKYAKIRKCHG